MTIATRPESSSTNSKSHSGRDGSIVGLSRPVNRSTREGSSGSTASANRT